MALQIGQEAAGPDFTSLAILCSDPRLAVRSDFIVCLICGGQFRQLTNTHLRAHGTGVIEYKIRFGYNRRRALMSRKLRRLYTERAVGTGLAAHIRHRPIVEAPSCAGAAACGRSRSRSGSRGARRSARHWRRGGDHAADRVDDQLRLVLPDLDALTTSRRSGTISRIMPNGSRGLWMWWWPFP
jgi:hypothetical protein